MWKRNSLEDVCFGSLRFECISTFKVNREHRDTSKRKEVFKRKKKNRS